MQKIIEAAGLPHFSFHSLRHACATRMLEANISAKVVQDILGHSDVALTLNTYSHVIGTTAHEQMAKIDGLFELNDSKDKPVGNKSDAKITIEKKPSIKSQLIDAKQDLDSSSRKSINKIVDKGDPEL